MTTFDDFSLLPEIKKALDEMGYKEPTPIQTAAFEPISSGKHLIALASTGSGKTAACAIPVCNKVNIEDRRIQVLIIVPTRELALQYATETQKIGTYREMSTFALFGGADYDLQKAKLKDGIHILVATPGRLMDFIYNRHLDLSNVTTLILDEADEMLGMGFFDDVEFIVQCLVKLKQILLFSATMPPAVRKLAKQYMPDAHEVTLNAEKRIASGIEHKFLFCSRKNKEQEFIKLFHNMKPSKSIIFCHSRIESENIYYLMKKNRIYDMEYIHAGLDQNVRTSITDKFRRGKLRHLIGTDVLARGLDFSDVTHVFIYHLSDNTDMYVHRSGRTGRYDKEGESITMVTERDIHSFKLLLKVLEAEPIWIGTPPPGLLQAKKIPLQQKEKPAPQRKLRPKHVGEPPVIAPKTESLKAPSIPELPEKPFVPPKQSIQGFQLKIKPPPVK